MSHSSNLFLLTFSGTDRPGVTAKILGELDGPKPPKLLDLSQALVGQHLTLSLLIETTPEAFGALQSRFSAALTGVLEGFLAEMEPYSISNSAPFSIFGQSFALTLIGEPIEVPTLLKITTLLAGEGLTISQIKRLSSDNLACVELHLRATHKKFSLTEIHGLREKLLNIGRADQIDIALQEECLLRRSKRLVVMDMDSTLIQNEVIDELAREKGVYEQVAAITHSAMSGQIPYEESLQKRCALLKGLPVEALERVYSRVKLSPGAEVLISVLKRLGYRIGVLSGGFTFVAERLRDRLGIDYAYANVLEIENGVVTGQVRSPIVHAQRKADLLETIAQQERIRLEQVIAIGDGANDLLMLEKAGLGIAFNAKPAVRERAHTSLTGKNLRNVLYFLGYSSHEIQELENQASS